MYSLYECSDKSDAHDTSFTIPDTSAPNGCAVQISFFGKLLSKCERVWNVQQILSGWLYTFHISHFADILRMYSQNTKHPLYTFCISFEFQVLEKINYEKSFPCFAIIPPVEQNGVECKMWKKCHKITGYTFLIFFISRAFHAILRKVYSRSYNFFFF